MTLLRPEYTRYLFNQLQKNSLNIYAPHGQGQLRLLEDLQQLAQVEGDWVFLIKMKSYAESYSGFVQALAKQLIVFMPEIEPKKLLSLADIFAILESVEAPQRRLFLLHDFDALLDNPQIDPAYNVDFFNSLNALKNQGHRLVCITERSHNKSQVFVGGKAHSSWLDLKSRELPHLTYEEVKQELLSLSFKADHPDLNTLIDAIKQHPQSYQFLDFAFPQLKFSDDKGGEFKRRLKRLHQDFDERECVSVFKKVHKINKWSQCLAILTGINKFKTPFMLILDLAKKVIGK